LLPDGLPKPEDAGRDLLACGLLEMIDSAVLGYEPFFPVRLVVFPEFAHTPPVYFTVEELRERLAVPIPNEHTDRYTARDARATGLMQAPTERKKFV